MSVIAGRIFGVFVLALTIFPLTISAKNLWSFSIDKDNDSRQEAFIESESESVIAKNINSATEVQLSISDVRQIRKGQEINFPLSNDQTLAGVVQSTAEHDSGHHTIKGKITGLSTPFVITSSDTAVFALIMGEDGPWSLIYKKGRGKLIKQSNMMRDVTIGDNDVVLLPEKELPHPKSAPNYQSDLERANHVYQIAEDDEINDEIITLTLLIYYASDTQELYDSDVETKIRHIVEVNNQIYQDSGVHIRLDIAEMNVLEYSSQTPFDETLDELSGIRRENPLFEDVQSRRHEVGAHAVVFFQQQYDYCGLAIAPNGEIEYEAMYNVTGIDCPADTLGHELGHNFGLGHSRRQDSEGGYIYPFGLGHAEDDKFATIMAYPFLFGLAETLFVYSSPELECLGSPCGISRDTGSQSADAVLAQNLVRHDVADLVLEDRDLTRVSDVLESIEDTEFYQCVKDLFDPEQYLQTVTDLYCFQSLSSLDGISSFSNLREVYLTLSSDSDISDLAKMTHLKRLTLDGGEIQSTEALTELDSLRILQLYYVTLPEQQFLSELTGLQSLTIMNSGKIDSGTLQSLTSLRELTIRNGGIDSLNFVENLEFIEMLSLDSNEISDISPLKDMSGIRHLYLGGNRITSFGEDIKLPLLRTLDLNANPLESIDGVTYSPLLKVLRLNRTQLSGFSLLNSLNALTELGLADNNIESFTQVPGIESLSILNLSNNQISSLADMGHYPNLRELYLSNNSVSEITGLEKTPLLLEIYLDNSNDIQDLSPLSGAKYLRVVSLNNSGLKSLDGFPVLGFLERLLLANNNISEIKSVYLLQRLRSVNLSENPVVDLSPLVGAPRLWNVTFQPSELLACAGDSGFTNYSDLSECFESSDSDGDGISNSEDLDDDNDGIPDSLETDFDQDNILNHEDRDDDADGLIDPHDDDPILNPFDARDADLDFDNDGLSNLEEFNIGTLLNYADSDGDGIADPDDSSPLPILISDAIAGLEDEYLRECLLEEQYTPILPTGIVFAVGAHSLSCYNQNSAGGAESLAGMEAFGPLRDLRLRSHNISDLEPLAGMTQLETLFLSGNQISDITPLESMSELKYLGLDQNMLSDASVLSNLNSLESLSLINNDLEDIGFVAEMERLTSLFVGGNPVTDLSVISKLTELKELGLTALRNVDPEYFVNIENMTALRLGNTNIRDIEFLKDANNLVNLQLQYLGINDISPLRNKEMLGYLDLSFNDVSDLTPLESSRRLGIVYLYGNNKITCVDVSHSYYDYQGLEPCFLPIDTDGDGIPDNEDTDDDNDGMPDDWEDANDLDSLSDDASGDLDADGLSNSNEYLNATFANYPDSDNDFITDGFEVDNALDPLSSVDADQDLDGDGVTNLDEYLLGTDVSDESDFVFADKVLVDFESETQTESIGWQVNEWQISADDAFEGALSLKTGEGEEITTWLESESDLLGFTARVKLTGDDGTFALDVYRDSQLAFNMLENTQQKPVGEWIGITSFGGTSARQLDFLYTHDSATMDAQAYIDNVTLYYGDTADNQIEENLNPYDFDGDGNADVAVRRKATNYQYIKNSGDPDIQRIVFGSYEQEIPFAGHIDDDELADLILRNPKNGSWTIRSSSSGETEVVYLGTKEEDIPVPADYDGDGIIDMAVRRPSTSFWYIKNSSGVDEISGNADGISRIQFGRQRQDIPVPADYDGDGKADIAVRRPSSHFWYIRNSSGVDPISDNLDGISRRQFGRQASDIPVPGDYDGDGRADLAVRRPAQTTWFILNSSGSDYNSLKNDGIQRIRFGLQSSDIPIPADYDGDGITDVAVRRSQNFYQYILNSRDGQVRRVPFGRNVEDIPLAAPAHLKPSLVNSE